MAVVRNPDEYSVELKEFDRVIELHKKNLYAFVRCRNLDEQLLRSKLTQSEEEKHEFMRKYKRYEGLEDNQERPHA